MHNNPQDSEHVSWNKKLTLSAFGGKYILGLSKRLNTLTKEVMGSDCTIEMGKNFLEYWTELNKSQTKMRFEMEKTWDTKRRLGRWEQNQKNWGSGKGKFATKTQEALTTWQAARNIIENENKRN